jgi:glycyl-tRNA synthetase beta subunit
MRQQVVMASLAHQVISGRTLSSPATLSRLQSAIQRSVVISAGWDVMDFLKQLQKLAAGHVAFATIPVLAEDGWSDDGMQSVVRLDPAQVKEWVSGLLQDQAEKDLAAAVTRVQPEVDAAFAAGDFSGTLKTLAQLRDQVDAFFNDVMVMAEDLLLRNNRLALLSSLHGMMNRVADISKLAA